MYCKILLLYTIQETLSRQLMRLSIISPVYYVTMSHNILLF